MTPPIGEIYVIGVDPDTPRPRAGAAAHAGRPRLASPTTASSPPCSTSTPGTWPPYACTSGSVSCQHRTRYAFAGTLESLDPPTERHDRHDRTPWRPTIRFRRWSVADVFESLHAPEFVAAMERVGAESTRLAALFDEHDIRADRAAAGHAEDGAAADARDLRCQRDARRARDRWRRPCTPPSQPTPATSTPRPCSAELEVDDAVIRPLLARLADWVRALGVDSAGHGQRRDPRAPRPAAAPGRRAPIIR